MITGGLKGAMNEYLVSVDLMKRGFTVYRNMSPNGMTDLIATRTISDKELLVIFVQVKSNRGGINQREKRQNDILAVVNDDNTILYRVTPGLKEYFQDAPLGKGLFVDKTDSFTVIKRKDESYTSLRKLSIHSDSVDDRYRVYLRRGRSRPISAFEFKKPEDINDIEFANRITDVSAQIMAKAAKAEDSRELEKQFEYFPNLLGMNPVPCSNRLLAQLLRFSM